MIAPETTRGTRRLSAPRLPVSAERWLLAALLALYLVAATLFALLTPRWQAPDEPAHFNYVAHVAATGWPPVLVAGCYQQDYLSELTSRRFPPSLPVESLCYEGHQPPLYYYSAVPAFWLGQALGIAPLFAVRLWSVLIGAGVVLAAFRVARAVTAHRWLPLLAAGIVATVPMHLTMLSAVNNDGLSTLLVTLAVWQALRQPLAAPRAAWLRLGLLLGLCLLTKATAYIALPLALLALLLRWHERRPPLSRAVRANLGYAALTTLLLGLPWFARNSLTYGGLDLLGLGRHDAIVTGQPRTSEWVAARGLAGYLTAFGQTTFNSFWGQFGWMAAPLPPRFYTVLALLTLAALLGLGWRAWRTRQRGLAPERVRPLALLLAWVGLNVAIYLWYNLKFVQFQGRYLFPSLPAIAIFLAAGWLAWVPRRVAPLAVGALVGALWLLDLWSLFRVILPHLRP